MVQKLSWWGKGLLLLCAALLACGSTSCKDGGDDPVYYAPGSGTLAGTVEDLDSGNPIAGARVIILDAETNAAACAVQVTDGSGAFSVALPAGQYLVLVSATGYYDVPPVNMVPLPVDVTTDATESVALEMVTNPNASNVGSVSGAVSGPSGAMGGVMVSLSNATSGYSTISGSDGSYVIFNVVPATDYIAIALYAGYSSSTVDSIEVIADQETQDVDLTMTDSGTFTVTGQITYRATTNQDVRVVLIDPFTRRSIPGASDFDRGTFSIGGIAPGSYIVRASYDNDGLVVDPFTLLKFGETTVAVTDSNVDVGSLSVTGAVELTAPDPTGNPTVPDPAATTLTFTWANYPSAKDYVVEVVDINGIQKWGGFQLDANGLAILDGNDNPIPRHAGALVTGTTVDYDTAVGDALAAGRTYQVRVYARVVDESVTSSTENLVGVFNIEK